MRIPRCRADKPHSMRIELRSPDPSCNPYLALAAVLAAGLKGIEEKYDMPAHTNSKNRKYCIPADLSEAISAFEKSSLMRNTFGDFITDQLIENKHAELERYHKYITDFELKEYLPIL
ncbi:MAG: hypothetical protein ACRCUT_04835 [Spirochaetota bacterium]